MTTHLWVSPPRHAPAVAQRLLGAALCLVVAALTIGVIGVAPPAAAHSELVSTLPAADEVLRKAPPQVELTFGETVLDQGTVIVVTDQDGTRVDQPSTLSVDGTKASVQLRPASDGGTYEVTYRVLSADGHQVEGAYEYRVALLDQPSNSSPAVAQPTTTPVADTESDEASGGIIWVLGLGAIGVVLVAAMIAVFTRKRRD